MMELEDYINFIFSVCKDKAERDALEKKRASLNALISTEADVRRKGTAVDILEMNKLQIALDEFEFQYRPIKEKFGENKAINKLIAETQTEIKTISRKKNHKKK